MTEDIIDEKMGAKLRPQFNSPMVLYLCSEENQTTGQIFAMGAGWYARTAIVSGDGVCLGDAERDIQPEEIRDNWDKIGDLSNDKPHDSGTSIFSYMMPLLS